MIDLGRETDGNNENCLGVRFGGNPSSSFSVIFV